MHEKEDPWDYTEDENGNAIQPGDEDEPDSVVNDGAWDEQHAAHDASICED